MICTATCIDKHKFPKGETVLNIDCINKVWKMKHDKYKGWREIPACARKLNESFLINFKIFTIKQFSATCNPVCANRGKCIAPNRCQCTANFQGPTCREKACKQQPAMTKNAKRTCSASWVEWITIQIAFKVFFQHLSRQCTVTCLPGFKFKSQVNSMNLQCRNGNWASATRNLQANLHCERELTENVLKAFLKNEI